MIDSIIPRLILNMSRFWSYKLAHIFLKVVVKFDDQIRCSFGEITEKLPRKLGIVVTTLNSQRAKFRTSL